MTRRRCGQSQLLLSVTAIGC